MADVVKIFESEYGGTPNNFHVSKHGPELIVELTYPPYSDEENTKGQCRYIYVNQESVRASDGVRLHYDFNRDGFVVEQPRSRYIKLKDRSYDTITDWIEVGFFQSWVVDNPNNDDDDALSNARFAKADEDYDASQRGLAGNTSPSR